MLGRESGISDSSHEEPLHQCVCAGEHASHLRADVGVHEGGHGACVQKVCDVAEGHRTEHLSSHSSVDNSPVAPDVLPNISRTPFSNL